MFSFILDFFDFSHSICIWQFDVTNSMARLVFFSYQNFISDCYLKITKLDELHEKMASSIENCNNKKAKVRFGMSKNVLINVCSMSSLNDE